MDLRTTTSGSAPARRGRGSRRRPPAPVRRPALYLGVATAGAVLVNVLAGADPAAQADAVRSESVSVAQQLGLTSGSSSASARPDLQPLADIAAGRSTREAEQTAAQQAQAAADQAVLDQRKAEEEAAARAAAEAAAKAEAEAAAKAEAEAEAAAAEAAEHEEEAEEAAAPASAVPAPVATLAAAVAKITNSAGSVKPSAQAAANAVVSNVPGAAGITIGGTRASAADPGGHPSGLALDFMCSSALGDAIAQYHIDHWAELGVEYVIWKQRMLSSPNGSWKPMEDRGSATANHMDHVHVNYNP